MKKAENVTHTVWSMEKSKSDLDPSVGLMKEDRKSMIRFALDFEIKDIRSYSGYKGDLLIEITTFSPLVVERLKMHAISLGMETVVKHNVDMGLFQLYCITPDDIYRLIEPE